MEPLPEKKGDSSNFKVVGLNVGIFALYCIISALTAGNIFSALPVFIIHIILCFVLAIVLRKGIWALSGLLILVIGFSTCVVGVMSSWTMEEAKKTNANPKMVIVGLNILILLMYTIYFRFIAPAELNILADAVAIAFHITACLVLAIFIYRREFLLSAGLVLIIGFSTCMMAYTL